MKQHKLIFAGIILASTTAMADGMVPAYCESLAKVAAQSLDVTFGASDSGVPAPSAVTLDPNAFGYTITDEKLVANCMDAGSAAQAGIPASYCRAAGGAPEVVTIQFAKQSQDPDSTTLTPVTAVTVTFNRGTCWVDSANRL